MPDKNQQGYTSAEWSALSREKRATAVYTTRMPEFIKRLLAAEKKLLHALGIAVAGQAMLLAPVDTGNLAGSIDYQVDETAKTVTIGTPVEYGIYQELGTRKMAAQPYLVPSFVAMMPKLQEYARKEFKTVERLGELSVRLPDDNPGTDD